jgi:hypothetical protein
MQLPTIKELAKALTDIKRFIDRDVREIDVTLAADERGYALQAGDNSFTGAAYSFRHWGVGVVQRRTNSRELAKDLINQCRELASY